MRLVRVGRLPSEELLRYSKLLLEPGLLARILLVSTFVVCRELEMVLVDSLQAALKGLTALLLGLVADSSVQELCVRFVERHAGRAELCQHGLETLGRGT